MRKKSMLRVSSILLSTLILASSVTACTKENSKTAVESSVELVEGENELQDANAAVSNNIEVLDTQKEAEDVDSVS